jgi:hypothetical protein
LEADRKDAAELLERAIHARQVTLAGRRDDEAHQIRERAPSREQLAEILKVASGLWREFNNEDKAAAVGRLAEEFARPGDRERVARERDRQERDRPEREREARPDRDRPVTERDEGRESAERRALVHQLEVMRVALHGLREAERADAAEVLQRAIRAREVTLEGRRDDEAHQIRERAPSKAQLAEIMGVASGLWREFGNAENAELVARAARELSGERERPATERRRAADMPVERMERLENAVRQMNGQLEEMRRQMEEMRRIIRSLAEQEEDEDE